MADKQKPFDTIEASDVALSHIPSEPGPAGDTQNHRHARPQIIYIVAIISLLVISLAFVMLQNQRRANDANENPGNPTAESAERANPTIDKGPFKQAQTAAQRRQAQDLLASILEKQKALESQEVALWAGADYLDAQSKATQGDERYGRGQFEAAQQQYQLSLEQLSDIEARFAPFISDTLADALKAINTAGNAEDITKARASLQLLLQIQADNEPAKKGLERLDQLPQVRELLATGDQNFTDGKLEEALNAYQKAIKLDPDHPQAIAGLEQTQTTIKSSQFQSALNKGFADLGQSNYAAASQAFKRALTIEPHSDVAAQALQQTQTELNQIHIKQLLASASSDEQQERWSLALDAYNKALTIDGSVVSASVGKIRSQTRAKLDADLTDIITEPLRLASPSVYQQARQLLSDAQGIQPGGSRLGEQVRQLEQALVLATTPQTITLTSDNATRVTILRVGKLGQFDAKTIELKPGKYVAEGIRQGYRDVRIKFIVDGKNDLSPIQITCREAI
ncbi:MAG: tetratricopeptide repeat protein [Porticoccaceae bacterium]|nr:tetratricopeptide repeat protein [Porticoccaceae bacterium]